jgi:hypothetical protein
MDVTGGQFHSLAAFPPAQEPSVSTEWEAGWTPELFWTLWRTQKFFCPCLELNHDSYVSNRQPSRYSDIETLLIC